MYCIIIFICFLEYVDQLSNAENNIKEAEEDLEKVSNSLENVNSNIDRLKETKVSEISKRVVDGVANANEAVTLALDQSERARRESAENVAKMEYIVNNRHRATESLRDTENDVFIWLLTLLASSLALAIFSLNWPTLSDMPSPNGKSWFTLCEELFKREMIIGLAGWRWMRHPTVLATTF
uniref:Uncharacterized protein n=1 Tax=Biomphalaria glabrata TaxID=6526 RepID=A0A2C9LNN8_BIOGL